MKKQFKKQIATMMISAAATISMCVPAFAGTWLSNSNGWYWMNDNGSYPANEWQWIDGDGDGVSECYYFDENGYCLINTMTPDGYNVNGVGAWTVDGDVQKQQTHDSGPADNGGTLPNPEGGMQDDDRIGMNEPQHNDSRSEMNEPQHNEHHPEINKQGGSSQSSTSGQIRACLDDMDPDYTNYNRTLNASYTSGGEQWQGSQLYGLGNGNSEVIKDYYLAGQYNTLTFEAVPYSGDGGMFSNNAMVDLIISDYDTGKVLYSKKGITADTKKFSGTVDVSGVQYLRIRVSPNSGNKGWFGYMLLKDQYLY